MNEGTTYGDPLGNARSIDTKTINSCVSRALQNQIIRDSKTKKILQSVNESEPCTPIKDYWTRVLRDNDIILATQRYKWNNLPPEIKGQDIERLFYYRGKVGLLFLKPLNRWIIADPTLLGQIDYLGRFNHLKPLPFTGSDLAKKVDSNLKILLSQEERKVLWDMPRGDGLDFDPQDLLDNYAFYATDRCQQQSQTILTRQSLNDGIIDIEANIPCYINTLLSNSTGVTGVRVNGDDEAYEVQRISNTANNAALNAKRFLAMNGRMDWQDLSTAAQMRAEDMLLSLQSLDNIRLNALGLENGGIFEKNAHMLQTEANMRSSTAKLILEDGLYQRQRLCDQINNGILKPAGYPPETFWDCQVNPAITGISIDLDSFMTDTNGYDDQDPNAQQVANGGGEDGN